MAASRGPTLVGRRVAQSNAKYQRAREYWKGRIQRVQMQITRGRGEAERPRSRGVLVGTQVIPFPREDGLVAFVPVLGEVR